MSSVTSGWRIFRLDIPQSRGGESHADSIQDGHEINEFLSDGAIDRRQKAEGGSQHAHGAERHSADRALKSNGSHTTADVYQFVYFAQGRLEDDGICGFGGDVAVQAKGEADRGCLHGWRVVNAVTDKQGLCTIGFFPDNGDLLFRALSGIDLADSDGACQIDGPRTRDLPKPARPG